MIQLQSFPCVLLPHVSLFRWSHTTVMLLESPAASDARASLTTFGFSTQTALKLPASLMTTWQGVRTLRCFKVLSSPLCGWVGSGFWVHYSVATPRMVALPSFCCVHRPGGDFLIIYFCVGESDIQQRVTNTRGNLLFEIFWNSYSLYYKKRSCKSMMFIQQSSRVF